MQKKEQLLSDLAGSLLSNEITIDEITKLCESVKPNGAHWLLHQTRQLLQIDITIDIANVIKEYAANIQIYDLLKSGPYSIPYSLHSHGDYTQFTMSFWCKPQLLNEYQSMITTEPLDSIARKYGWGFRFRIRNLFMFYVMGGHGYSAVNLASKTKLDKTSINKWYHICGVYNGLNGNAKLYVNGVLENEQTVDQTNYPLLFTSKEGLQIGSLVNRAESFNGLLYDFIMYNKLMSKEEIYRGYTCRNFSCDENNVILKSIDMIEWTSNNMKNEQTMWTPQNCVDLKRTELNDLFV